MISKQFSKNNDNITCLQLYVSYRVLYRGTCIEICNVS